MRIPLNAILKPEDNPFKDKIYNQLVTFYFDKSIPINSDDQRIITINSCQFLEGIELEISSSLILKEGISITFEDCLLGQKSDFSNLTLAESQIMGITFLNCIINELDVHDSVFTSIAFSRVIVISIAKIFSSKINTIHVQNCLGNFFIVDEGFSSLNILYSEDNLFRNRKHTQIYRKLTDKYKIEKVLYMPTKFHLNELKKVNISFRDKYEHEGYRIDNIYNQLKYYLTKDDLNKIDISITISQRLSLTESIKIKSPILKSLSLNGESDSDFSLDHLKSDKVFIHGFRAKKLQLYDIRSRNKSGSQFDVVNSNLGEANFVRVYLNTFQTVNFYRSYFEQTKFSASKFPQIILTVPQIFNPHKKEDEYHLMQFEQYRQLKSSLLSNNNQIQALEMHSRMYNALQNGKGMKLQDRVILALNRVSNNHNTSIANAFALTIVALFTLWFFYCLCLPNAPYKIGWYGWGEFANGVSSFLLFAWSNINVIFVIANPVHNISSLSDFLDEGEELTTMNYLISFLSRIIIAWLFYQFVSAFRKFGKTL